MMKTIKIFILWLFFIPIFSFAKETVHLGLLYGNIFSTQKEARIGTNLWLKQMEELNLDADFDISFYKNEEEIIEDYKNNKLEGIITNGLFYYENKTFLEENSIEKWILSESEEKYIQYYLLKNSKLDLDLKKFNIQEILYKGDFEKIWIEHFLLKKGLSSRKINKSLVGIKKSKSAIFDLFFNEKKLAVVKKDIYDAMLHLNPQLEKKVDIVYKSKPIFFRGIGFTNKNISKKAFDILIEVKRKINMLEIDCGVLSFIQIQRVHGLENDDLIELDEVYNEYLLLK